jgi:hypothetical protein
MIHQLLLAPVMALVFMIGFTLYTLSTNSQDIRAGHSTTKRSGASNPKPVEECQ